MRGRRPCGEGHREEVNRSQTATMRALRSMRRALSYVARLGGAMIKCST